MKPRYWIVRTLFRLALRVFFGRVVIEGAARIPEQGGALIVANHTNGLVDGLLLLCFLERPICLVAKAALKGSPLLKALLWMIDAEVVHRRQDDSSTGAREANQVTLTNLADRIQRGEVVCIFPEGKSHSEPALLRFNSGAARIMLNVWEHGGDAPVIPVALLYNDKSRLRSAVVMRVMPAIAYPGSSGRSAALTKEFEARISEQVPQFETAEQRELARWIAEVFSAETYGAAALGTEHNEIGHFFALMQRCCNGIARINDPERKAEIISRLSAYRDKLQSSGFALRELFITVSPFTALVFLIRELEILFLGAIFSTAGLTLNAVPYFVTRQLVRQITKDEDQVATNSAFVGLGVFIAWIFSLVILIFCTLPWATSLFLCIAYYYVSVVLVLYVDRASAALTRSRAFLSIVRNRAEYDRLKADIEKLRIYLVGVEKELCP